MNKFKNLLLTIFSLALSLVIIEIFISFFYPQARNGSWRIQNQDGVFLNKNNGKSIHQFLGESEKISVEYNFGEYHNRILLNDKYKTNNNKVLVLGDSFIFGWLLKDEDMFVTKLQNYFNEYYFINAAAGGFGDVDMYLYIDRYCSEIQPKIILFFIDIDRALGKNSLEIDSKDELIINKNEINKLKRFLNNKNFYNFLMENFHSMQLIKKFYVQISNDAYVNYVKDNDQNLNKVKKIILNNKIEKKKINEENKNFQKEKVLIEKLFNKILYASNICNSKIIFIDKGWSDRKYDSKISSYVMENFFDIFDESKFNFISIYDEMENIRQSKNKYLLEEGHPNAEANDLFFKYLKPKLLKYFN